MFKLPISALYLTRKNIIFRLIWLSNQRMRACHTKWNRQMLRLWTWNSKFDKQVKLFQMIASLQIQTVWENIWAKSHWMSLVKPCHDSIPKYYYHVLCCASLCTSQFCASSCRRNVTLPGIVTRLDIVTRATYTVATFTLHKPSQF